MPSGERSSPNSGRRSPRFPRNSATPWSCATSTASATAKSASHSAFPGHRSTRSCFAPGGHCESGSGPAGGAAIAVPLAVREGLAQAVPWFAPGPAAGASAAVGAGILAQLEDQSPRRSPSARWRSVSRLGRRRRRAARAAAPGAGTVRVHVPREATGTDSGRASPARTPTRSPLRPRRRSRRSPESRPRRHAVRRRPHRRVPSGRPVRRATGQAARPEPGRADARASPHGARRTLSRPAPRPERASDDQDRAGSGREPPVSQLASRPASSWPAAPPADTATTETRTEPAATTPTRTSGSTIPTR